ncbi:MAG TPA: RNA-binding transcriptional accessory protein [Candidatus Bilophila faecipullorum]|uniref:RNA-binding transcriptional accessory protein n=4 Tax=Bilophila TaxID=35832 RepID=A0A9D1R0P1_9BACT|nr:Tex family protein [uncultured Bilophila sp.]HIW79551.1 RNA-binding transcriptional accessory protein [Candidatus Bilophila faecipullorum]
MSDYASLIAQELGLRPAQAGAVIRLLDEGATVPFIARYRKEATGSLDEVAVTAIRDRLAAGRELDKRREAIVASLEERNLLTPELRAKVEAAASLTLLEDIYLPYRPKRRTRASAARERGLEPLADLLARQERCLPETLAAGFVAPDKDVADAEAALAGARDILAERFAEDQTARERLRGVFGREGLMRCKAASGKEDDPDAAKYRDYFAWDEPAAQAPPHRILAMLRGEEEGFLRLSLRPRDEERAKETLARLFVRNDGPCGREVRAAALDGYARLLAPALETELRNRLKERADAASIRVFADNLRQLLLAPPLGPKSIIAVDPGFRTGCKAVCLSPEGKLLEYATVNPHAGSDKARAEAGATLVRLALKHGAEVAAVGNGTAGRETEAFIRSLPDWPPIPVVMVSENGASVYSASEAARAEFPDLDLTYRGAVSIGRRLADPLAELVKIDPKAIGVGQYQHDVNQTELKRCLDDVVTSCVNAVGVELNTASEQLLAYVSGLGPTLARNIVAFRHENGPFQTRRDLLKVPRLGPKAFEQCSGFLRIRGGRQPLDASAVHPESYAVVECMAKDAGTSVSELMRSPERRRAVDISRYVTDTLGLPTLTDIMKELEKPGRDPRGPFKPFAFAEGVHALEDLRPGMKLPGIVTNITAFGAFVDIGVHQDGLVHISQLADRFVRDPNEVVRVHQEVAVTVLDVDIPRKRISLSMRNQ